MKIRTLFLLLILTGVIIYQKGGFHSFSSFPDPSNMQPAAGSNASSPFAMAAPNNPVQDSARKVPPISKDNFIITPLASYSIEALVLSKKNYSSGTEAKLSPTDLALGWGPMSSKEVLQHMKISQSGRWYHYRYQGSIPIHPKEIITHSANTHIIPANNEVHATLKKVRQYDVVQMRGYLVSITKQNGNWRWKSSTTRADSGDGSCELFYVTSLSIK